MSGLVIKDAVDFIPYSHAAEIQLRSEHCFQSALPCKLTNRQGFLRCCRYPIRVPRIENRVPGMRENYHRVPRIKENRVPTGPYRVPNIFLKKPWNRSSFFPLRARSPGRLPQWSVPRRRSSPALYCQIDLNADLGRVPSRPGHVDRAQEDTSVGRVPGLGARALFDQATPRHHYVVVELARREWRSKAVLSISCWFLRSSRCVVSRFASVAIGDGCEFLR